MNKKARRRGCGTLQNTALYALAALGPLASRGELQESVHQVGFAPGSVQVVGATGDVDLDGFRDFAVGSVVYSGRDASVLFSLPNPGDIRAVCEVGDFNDDGVPDIAVAGSQTPTRVHSGIDGAILGAFPLASCGQLIGQSVAPLGDATGDGDEDFGLCEIDTCMLGGSVGVIDGVSGSTSFETSQIGSCQTVAFHSIVGLGDVDGDGLGDFATTESDLGACTQTNRITARRGDGSTIWNIDLSLFAVSVQVADRGLTALGDLDSDGARDLAAVLVLSPTSTRVRVLSGRTGQTLMTIDGLPPAIVLGNPGDVNCDGVSDLAIADPSDQEAGFLAGKIELRSGVDGSLLRTVLGLSGSQLGRDLAGLGDINNDGLDDWIALGNNFARVLTASGPEALIYCTGKTNALGCEPAIATSGIAALDGPLPLTVEASNAAAQKPGLLFWSRSGPAELPFSGGLLCMQPPLRRTPLQFSGGLPPCGGSFDFAFDESYVTEVGISPGDTLNAQYWLRDPDALGEALTGLSNAVQIEFCP